jgi:hypothetical protein
MFKDSFMVTAVVAKKRLIVHTTEYTEWKWPLSCVYSIMMVKSAQCGDLGVHAPPPHSVYHHEQSCGVRSS